MNRKMPTLLILMVMLILGVMFWIDLNYYTDPETGFIIRGQMWARYLFILLPAVMSFFGLKTVGAHSVGVLRRRQPLLGVIFAVAGFVALIYSVMLFVSSIKPFMPLAMLRGASYLFYSLWTFFAAVMLLSQNGAAPIGNAMWGALAAIPFFLSAVGRVIIDPTGFSRIGPTMRSVSALIMLLWLSTMLRGFYIALTRRRVRWLYVFGIFTFFAATCIELPFAFYSLMLGNIGIVELFDALVMAFSGLCAGVLSVEIGGSPAAKRQASEFL